jgi:hypothetical protein
MTALRSESGRETEGSTFSDHSLARPMDGHNKNKIDSTDRLVLIIIAPFYKRISWLAPLPIVLKPVMNTKPIGKKTIS